MTAALPEPPSRRVSDRPRVSFLLVTIPSEVSRGVVARSVAALSKGPFGAAHDRPNRLLGYVENMSGYYCRDCDAIKPLFGARESFDGAHPSPSRGTTLSQSKGHEESPGLEIPCLGTVPFDPELARHCDRGIPLTQLSKSPVGLALEQVAQQLLHHLESTSASATVSAELRGNEEHTL